MFRTRLPKALTLCAVLLTSFGLPLALAQEWYRVESSDGRASVLFPNQAEDVREMVDKTPGGKVTTRVAEHQGEGIMLTISETKLPTMAMSFAGPKLIFSNAKGKVLGKAFGREISSESIEVDGADASMVLRYESVDFDDPNHPGYAGMAIFTIVEEYIYVINSMLSKATPGNEAMQEKLLGSLRIQR